MAKAPLGAMSSPWGEGGEMTQMLKDTSYFKDATFNTEGKKPDTPPSPVIPAPSLFAKPDERPQGKAFDSDTKKAIVNLLMDNNIDPVNITESDIIFKYKGGLFKVTMI